MRIVARFLLEQHILYRGIVYNLYGLSLPCSLIVSIHPVEKGNGVYTLKFDLFEYSNSAFVEVNPETLSSECEVDKN